MFKSGRFYIMKEFGFVASKITILYDYSKLAFKKKNL